MEIEKLLFQSVMSFVTLFIISKILGKKQIAQLEFTDYIIGISIGSIAANMATEPDLPFYFYIIAMTVFGILTYLVTVLSNKGVLFKKILIGKPIVIIEKGKLNYKNFKKSKLSVDELLAQARLDGYFNLSEVYYCIFEVNGQFSFMPISTADKPSNEDMQINKEETDLPISLIIDGKIIKRNLSQINKTQSWLFNRLKIQNKKEIKNIIFVNYSADTDEFYVSYKTENNDDN